ncbi:MAG TPA: histidine kinase [Gemmatimonadaceae bacterium]
MRHIETPTAESGRIFPTRRILAACAVAAGLGTLFALVAAGQIHLYARALGRDLPLGQLLATYLARWYLWAALAPVIFAVARRWRLGGGRRRKIGRRLLILGTAAVGFALLHSMLSALADLALGVAHVPVPLAVAEHVTMFFVSGLVVATAIIAVSHALDYYRRYRNRELRASRLEARLARTQLQLLRMQLQPHFLFNTLNTVSSLMHEDVEAADAMLASLGDLLRLELFGDGAQEVALRQEAELTRCYLDIMRLRFGGGLSTSIEIEPDALDALVPNMVLQPLVENALRHGIARRDGRGRVEVLAQHAGSSLVITVLDDGPGLPEDWDERRNVGVGLTNTRSRLRRLYGAAQRLEIANRPEGGLKVSLTIPYRTAPTRAVPAA